MEIILNSKDTTKTLNNANHYADSTETTTG
jgi:hypothetical protein